MRRYERFLLLILLFASGAHAARVEQIVQLPAEVTDRHGRVHWQPITLTIFRDDARGKSPFLIINHGRAVDAAGRAKLGRARYTANAAYFVEHGFAVFVPTRIGYGVTGGPDVEDTGACNNRNYPSGYEAAAAQSMAVIQYAKAQRYVDAGTGIVLGQSYGGTAAAALAAKNIDGVRATINFAGGGGGNPATRPGNPCSAQRLAQLFADYGATARTPMLWLYSENDRYWGKDLPHRWFEGFTQRGGVAEFVQLPPSGNDGHGSFTANPAAWKPHVERFLKSLQLSN